jgi:PadR family transcriptional regulator, regulatory protein PadR
MPKSTQPIDLLQGTLDMLILKAVSLGALHGLGVLERIEQISGSQLIVQQGSLYPALHRLEAAGALQGEWAASENNRRAKFYSLTRKGRGLLTTETEKWSRMAEVIAAVLRATEAEVRA